MYVTPEDDRHNFGINDQNKNDNALKTKRSERIHIIKIATKN